jgi:hypothetical protein
VSDAAQITLSPMQDSPMPPPTPPSSLKLPKPWVEEVEGEAVSEAAKSRWNHDHTAFVEFFPSAEAGVPISKDHTHEIDLCAYIQACRVLADPEHFEVMELLMTAGLTNSAQDRFLKSQLVSKVQKFAWSPGFLLTKVTVV